MTPTANGKADMSPSDMFAAAHGTPNSGPYRCHWCGSAAIPRWTHDDRYVSSPYQKFSTARCPAEPYVCNGCWLWRRSSVTAMYLTGGLKDRQSPMNNSWWITPTAVWSLREEDFPTLLDILLKPPKHFALLLRHDKVPIHLHTAVANNLSVVKRDTALKFMYNQAILQYSAYELEQAAILGPSGLEPGVQALVRMLGMPTRDAVNEEERDEAERVRKRGGRPRETPIPHPNKDVVLASGEVAVTA